MGTPAELSLLSANYLKLDQCFVANEPGCDRRKTWLR
jgi:hypothetical protein